MPRKAWAPEEHCHLLHPHCSVTLCCLQEISYCCCTIWKMTLQISEAGKTVLWWHLNILNVACTYPISHELWAVRMGVKEPSQEQEVEQLFQHFKCLGQFVFNERESGVFFSFHPLVWFISPSVDTDTLSAWNYLHVSEDFQKHKSYNEPSYFAVKFHVSDGFPHTVARRWRYCLTKDILTKNFPEQIYLVMVNRVSHKMDIAGFISLVLALSKLHTSS